MEIQKIIDLILSEPIYLTIVSIFILAFIYSVLKKFFNLLLIVLLCLIGYISYLVYTNQDLPGDSDQLIYPLIDTAKEKAGNMLDGLSK